MHLAGIRRGSGSRASSGGNPPGTQHLHPGQQSENGECQTCPQPLFGTSEAVLLETVFLAPGILCGECGRSNTGNGPPLCGIPGNNGKGGKKKNKTVCLTPSWPTAQEEECADRRFNPKSFGKTRFFPTTEISLGITSLNSLSKDFILSGSVSASSTKSENPRISR